MTDGPLPDAIGGLGGSGTRVATSALRSAGYFMGKDLNGAEDNWSEHSQLSRIPNTPLSGCAHPLTPSTQRNSLGQVIASGCLRAAVSHGGARTQYELSSVGTVSVAAVETPVATSDKLHRANRSRVGLQNRLLPATERHDCGRHEDQHQHRESERQAADGRRLGDGDELRIVGLQLIRRVGDLTRCR